MLTHLFAGGLGGAEDVTEPLELVGGVRRARGLLVGSIVQVGVESHHALSVRGQSAVVATCTKGNVRGDRPTLSGVSFTGSVTSRHYNNNVYNNDNYNYNGEL